MKAETKAKRRGTLSICGLGMLDESELETIAELPKAMKQAPIAEPQELPPPNGEATDGGQHTTESILENLRKLKTDLRESKKFSTDEINDFSNAVLEFQKEKENLMSIYNEWDAKLNQRRK